MALNAQEREELDKLREYMEADLKKLIEIKSTEDPEDQYIKLIAYYINEFFRMDIAVKNGKFNDSHRRE